MKHATRNHAMAGAGVMALSLAGAAVGLRVPAAPTATPPDPLQVSRFVVEDSHGGKHLIPEDEWLSWKLGPWFCERDRAGLEYHRRLFPTAYPSSPFQPSSDLRDLFMSFGSSLQRDYGYEIGGDRVLLNGYDPQRRLGFLYETDAQDASTNPLVRFLSIAPTGRCGSDVSGAFEVLEEPLLKHRDAILVLPPALERCPPVAYFVGSKPEPDDGIEDLPDPAKRQAAQRALEAKAFARYRKDLVTRTRALLEWVLNRRGE